MSLGPVFLIGCSAQKLSHPAPARDLYIGHQTRMAIAVAEHLGARAFILSSLYGLVELDQVLAPYNLRVDHVSQDRGQEWGRVVLDRLSRLTPIRDVLFLAGGNYLERIPFGSEWRVRQPMQGLGMGARSGWLSRWIKSLGAPDPTFLGKSPGAPGGRQFDKR